MSGQKDLRYPEFYANMVRHCFERGEGSYEK